MSPLRKSGTPPRDAVSILKPLVSQMSPHSTVPQHGMGTTCVKLESPLATVHPGPPSQQSLVLPPMPPPPPPTCKSELVQSPMDITSYNDLLSITGDITGDSNAQIVSTNPQLSNSEPITMQQNNARNTLITQLDPGELPCLCSPRIRRILVFKLQVVFCCVVWPRDILLFLVLRSASIIGTQNLLLQFT